MPLGALIPLVAALDVPVGVRGAALLGLVVAGGVMGVLLIGLIAWSRRRRASRARSAAARRGQGGPDPWREAARRVRVDPDDESPWPGVDRRGPDGDADS